MSTAVMEAMPSLEKLKRKRQPVACGMCNKRRVKCDVSIGGPPCSNCRIRGESECAMLESKKKRGAHGRFILANTDRTQDNEPENLSPTTLTPSGSATDNCCTSKTAEQAEFSVDLTNPSEAELAVSPATSQSSIHRVDNVPSHVRRDDKETSQGSPPVPRVSYFGESWYASFLLQMTNREPHQLHRHITHASQIVEVSPRDREARLNSRDQTNVLPNGAPPKHHVDSLVATYFARFHVMFPILSQHSFLASINDGSVSKTLLLSVLFVASTYCDSDVVHTMGYKTRTNAGDDLFHRAKASFDTDTISDRVTMIQCSFLLHYWWGKPTNFRDSLWWLATAIRSAQCMGMHRSIKNSRMTKASKQNWKRIWWCLYIRDRQVAFGTGSPLVINDLECDMEDLSMEDFRTETGDTEGTEETVYYLMAQARLSVLASSIYFRYLSPSQLPLSADAEHRKRAELHVKSTFKDWCNALPECMRYDGEGGSHLAVTLQMIHNHFKIVLLQRLQLKASVCDSNCAHCQTVLTAASSITRLAENALLHWGPEYFPQTCVTAIFLAMVAQYSGSRSCSDYKSQLLLQQLRSNLLSLQQFEQCYMLARWIRNLFKDILQPARLQPLSDSEHSTRFIPQIMPQPRDELRSHQSTPEGANQNTAYEVAHPTISNPLEGSAFQANIQVAALPHNHANSDINADRTHSNVGNLVAGNGLSRDDEWFLAFSENELFQSMDTSFVDPIQLEGLHYLANVVGSSGFGIDIGRDASDYQFA